MRNNYLIHTRQIKYIPVSMHFDTAHSARTYGAHHVINLAKIPWSPTTETVGECKEYPSSGSYGQFHTNAITVLHMLPQYLVFKISQVSQLSTLLQLVVTYKASKKSLIGKL